MGFAIRKLTPELAREYAEFFDNTPHDDCVDEHKCYCVCWSSKDFEGEDFSSREKRRDAAIRYAENGYIQGYFAYCNDKIVGWCNANTKADCLKCCSWRMFMEAIPTESDSTDKIKSIFCFTVAPEMKRKGTATMLLKHVCEEAAREGFDFVEAYPSKKSDKNMLFAGTTEMYKKCGFKLHYETDDRYIVRKSLKLENNR